MLEEQTVTKTNEIPELLPQYEWLVAGMSERRHGNMRILANGDAVNVILRARFATELGVPGDRLVAPVLIHGATARRATADDLEERFEADALVTDERNLFLSVTAADCLPLFFVEGKKKVVGVAHAGWRGLLRGVIGETVAALEKLGADPARAQVAIGPAIGACHYQVSLPVARQFQEKLGADVITKRDSGLYLDLRKSASRLLGRAGIVPEHIKQSSVCTFCEERYFSHRRDGNHGVEAMMAVIGISDGEPDGL